MRSLQSEAMIDHTGQHLLTAVQDGVLPPPPIAMLLNLALEAVGEGRTTFSLPSEPAFDNGHGAIHGGVLAALADFAVSTAVMTVVPATARVVTSNLNVTYLRLALPNSGRLVCEGHVVHIGRRLAHADATVTDQTGELYATATATCGNTYQTTPSDRT